MPKMSYLRALILVSMVASAPACAAKRPPSTPDRPVERPITFSETSAGVTNEFQLHDSLVVEVRGLTPRAGYDLTIANEAGEILVANRLSTDALGHIPETVLWYAIGAQPCWRGPVAVLDAHLPYSRVIDTAVAGRAYALKVTRPGEAVRAATFTVAREARRPILYAADARGCPKTGFLIGEEDVWVVGRNFPAGGLLRLWTVTDQPSWWDKLPLEDRTGHTATT